MRISDWSSYVCSSDLLLIPLVRSTERSGNIAGCNSPALKRYNRRVLIWAFAYVAALFFAISVNNVLNPEGPVLCLIAVLPALPIVYFVWVLYRYLIEETDEYLKMRNVRSEEHTSELQSLMRISYAVFCLKKKKKRKQQR